METRGKTEFEFDFSPEPFGLGTRGCKSIKSFNCNGCEPEHMGGLVSHQCSESLKAWFSNSLV